MLDRFGIAGLTLIAWTCTICSSSTLAADNPVHVVIAIGEDEYHAKETLPEFAKVELQQKLHWDLKIVQSDDKTNMPGLEALRNADLLVMFLRRRELPEAQLKLFKDYFESGKSVVGIRTSCHAFQNWLEFDKVVLGCHYNNHYSSKPPTSMNVTVAKGAESNPLLRGVPKEFVSASTLYKVMPLMDSCTPLLMGTWTDKPAEPLAWTNNYKGARVFFTTLGSPEDFKSEAFVKLLSNGIQWAASGAVAAH